MFGLGITEIVVIILAVAVIYFLFWKNRKPKEPKV